MTHGRWFLWGTGWHFWIRSSLLFAWNTCIFFIYVSVYFKKFFFSIFWVKFKIDFILANIIFHFILWTTNFFFSLFLIFSGPYEDMQTQPLPSPLRSDHIFMKDAQCVNLVVQIYLNYVYLDKSRSDLSEYTLFQIQFFFSVKMIFLLKNEKFQGFLCSFF